MFEHEDEDEEFEMDWDKVKKGEEKNERQQKILENLAAPLYASASNGILSRARKKPRKRILPSSSSSQSTRKEMEAEDEEFQTQSLNTSQTSTFHDEGFFSEEEEMSDKSSVDMQSQGIRSYGSFMSVERNIIEPFKDVDMKKEYENARFSAKRSSKQRLPNKRISKHRGRKSAQKKRREVSPNLNVKEDFMMVVAAVSLGILSLIHLVRSLTRYQVSLLIGYALVVFGATTKIPFIQSLQEARTTEGLSLFKQYSDMLSITFTILFNIHRQLPFASWGEKAFVLAEDVYIVALMWEFSRANSLQVVTAVGAYGMISSGMLSLIRAVDAQYRWLIPSIRIVISKPGLAYQVYLNYKNGHTGALSATTQSMMSLLKALRLYTMFMQVPDPLLVLSSAIAFSLNFMLLIQIILYREKTEKVIRVAQSQRRIRLY